MNEMRKARIEEHDEDQKALKDDVDAVSLLGQAIESMTAFYNNNKLPLEFVQEDPKKPMGFSKGGYGGQKGQTGGIIAILSMIKEDLETEIKTANEMENAAQSEYEKIKSDNEAIMHKQIMQRTTLKGELADTLAKISIADGDLAGFYEKIKSDNEAIMHKQIMQRT